MSTLVHQTLNSQRLLRKCHKLALRVAPELKAAPLYVMNKPASYPHPVHTTAFTCRGETDFLLREELERQGRWEGAGPAIVFCEHLAKWEAYGVTLHETAHLLPFKIPRVSDSPLPAERKAACDAVADGFDKPVLNLPPCFPGHDGRFHRIALHLHARAWARGYQVGLPELRLAGQRYGMRPAWNFMHALGDEPKRLGDATFAEIVAEPFPKPFSKIFTEDLNAWKPSPETEPNASDS